MTSFLFLFTISTFSVFLFLGGLGYLFFDSKNKNDDKSGDSYSIFNSCNRANIPYDIQNLKYDLEENLYGQHIVNATLIPALQSHIKNLQLSQKPLVISFHGTPGTGKNFVADRIVKYFYKDGDLSKFVHKYRGRIDFPLASEVDIYRVGSIENSIAVTQLIYYINSIILGASKK